jgi:hypothetical protein
MVRILLGIIHNAQELYDALNWRFDAKIQQQYRNCEHHFERLTGKKLIPISGKRYVHYHCPA